MRTRIIQFFSNPPLSNQNIFEFFKPVLHNFFPNLEIKLKSNLIITKLFFNKNWMGQYEDKNNPIFF